VRPCAPCLQEAIPLVMLLEFISYFTAGLSILGLTLSAEDVIRELYSLFFFIWKSQSPKRIGNCVAAWALEAAPAL
jgi:hypothetical protein